MKKLKLNLDDLKVESFETVPDQSNNNGTVFGYGDTDEVNCTDDCTDDCTETLGGGDTCGNTCLQLCTYQGCSGTTGLQIYCCCETNGYECSGPGGCEPTEELHCTVAC